MNLVKTGKSLILGLFLVGVAGLSVCSQAADAYPYNGGTYVNPPGRTGGKGHGPFWRYNPAGHRGGPGKGWVWNPPGPGKYFFNKKHGCYR